jgi:TPR repeat protein
MTRPQASRRQTETFEGDYEHVPPERASGFNSPLIWIAVIVAFLIGYMVFSGGRKAPLSGSGEAEAPATPPTGLIQDVQAPTADKPGDTARAIVAEIREKGGKFNLTWVYNKADRLLKEKKLTDAYLLYFFAAREGHAPSALVLGKLADPQFHSAETSPLDKPDLVQALKWYQMASERGETEAKDHLQKLRQRIEADARGGDSVAQQLMLDWR